MSICRSPRHHPLALRLLLAFGSLCGPASADTVMDTGPGGAVSIGWEDAVPDLGQRYGNTLFLGQGRINKIGGSTAYWGVASATFALGAGALIDVQQDRGRPPGTAPRRHVEQQRGHGRGGGRCRRRDLRPGIGMAGGR